MSKHALAALALLIFMSGIAYAFKPPSTPKVYHISIFGAKEGAYEKQTYGQPAEARFQHQPTLKDAIEMAGGFSVFSNISRIWVIEQIGSKDPMLYDMAVFPDADKILLENRSIVVIQQKQLLF
ncbi:hypothetical protein [Cerasicoccus fimbriatus]|uniref:hypothetical protein n=1 Tax=Cerasicoccus fimbriatus TaxID=3014554 RepID=UPI0022B37393|nr:hypothetical protein [Cerasicoccus sp. TK19100]